MTARDFCYWLQGHFELAQSSGGLSSDQCALIRRHLAMVFVHDIDPKVDGGDASKKKVLDGLHSGIPGMDVIYRC